MSEGRGAGRSVLAAVLLYPAVTALARHLFVFTPFDPETVTRFVLEFRFGAGPDLAWTLGESLRWHLTRPLYSLTFLTDFLMYGTDHRLWHLTDFLLAWLSFALVAVLLFRSTGRRAAWTVLAVWAAMPAQIWSLFCFTGRNDRLAGLFVLAAVAVADRWRDRRPGALEGAAVPALMTAAFLSKESALLMLPLPFAWLHMVRGVPPGRLLRSTAGSWAPTVLLPPVFFGIRHALGMALGDTGALHTGTDWLHQFGGMVLEGLGGGRGLRIAAGAVVPAALAVLCLLRGAPALCRFGALTALLSMIPFAFVWTQPSFHWMPSLGAAMIAAGLLELPARAHPRATALLAVLLASAFAAWGAAESRRICALPITFHLAAGRLAGEEACWPAVGERAADLFPALSGPLGLDGSAGAEVSRKARAYLENLVRVYSGDPGASLSWPEDVSR